MTPRRSSSPRPTTRTPPTWSPGIQWYSLHTGLPYEQHGVFHLSDGPAAGHGDVWTSLLEGGLSRRLLREHERQGIRRGGLVFLPDPWCGSESPYPSELASYQDVIRTKVQENTNSANASPGGRAYVELARFLARHGLRTGTVIAIYASAAVRESGQVGHRLEAGGAPGPGPVRRLPSLLGAGAAYDFSTFFLNSTAHYQHAYWHLAFPESFPFPDEATEGDPKREAILFGYQQMDRLLARFFELEHEGGAARSSRRP